MRLSKGLDDKTHAQSDIFVSVLSSCGTGREIRPMTLMSWLTDLEFVAQAADAKMIRMEIFTSEDLTQY